eukprot:m.358568 g.358568  ORF g.358568 m.358568 type:complete len:307 (-) comp18186_c0_seq1:194-1114(-)
MASAATASTDMATLDSFFKPKKGGKRRSAGADEGAAEGAAEADAAPDATEMAANIALKKALAIARKTGIPSLETLDPTWKKALKAEFSKAYYTQLMEYLQGEKAKGKTIFPEAQDVHAWSRACPTNNIKVVIIGQDPYHGPKQAHGLCFSVTKDVAIPPSLRNIYKEMEKDVPGFKYPTHGNLMSWATQGVLLLNAVLTVEQANANAHKGMGWEKFTDAVIDYVNTNKKGVVFMLWGGYAKKKGKKIDKKKHCVLECAHPSPLSVTRWWGNKHFSKANEYLTSKGKDPINWASVCDDSTPPAKKSA